MLPGVAVAVGRVPILTPHSSRTAAGHAAPAGLGGWHALDLVFPIARDAAGGQAWVLGCYGSAKDAAILGVGPHVAVVELLCAGEDDVVTRARAALTAELELSPPRTTLSLYRPVLAAAERALAKAHARSNPDVEPSKRPCIADSQAPAGADYCQLIANTAGARWNGRSPKAIRRSGRGSRRRR